MAAKREITIHLITTSPQSTVSSVVNTISELAEDLTITCKVLGRTIDRTGKRTPSNRKSNRKSRPEDNAASEPKPEGPQLVYTADPEANHRRYIDVEASLKKLGLTREDLMSRTWARGSAQHRLKRAASPQRHAIEPATMSNGA